MLLYVKFCAPPSNSYVEVLNWHPHPDPSIPMWLCLEWESEVRLWGRGSDFMGLRSLKEDTWECLLSVQAQKGVMLETACRHHLQAMARVLRKKATLLAPKLTTVSGIVRLNNHCLSHPVYGTLLQQLELTNTLYLPEVIAYLVFHIFSTCIFKILASTLHSIMGLNW